MVLGFIPNCLILRDVETVFKHMDMRHVCSDLMVNIDLLPLLNIWTVVWKVLLLNEIEVDHCLVCINHDFFVPVVVLICSVVNCYDLAVGLIPVVVYVQIQKQIINYVDIFIYWEMKLFNLTSIIKRFKVFRVVVLVSKKISLMVFNAQEKSNHHKNLVVV